MTFEVRTPATRCEPRRVYVPAPQRTPTSSRQRADRLLQAQLTAYQAFDHARLRRERTSDTECRADVDAEQLLGQLLTLSGHVRVTGGDPIAIFAAWRGNIFVSLGSAAPMS
jgi:hypothetical protein